MMENGWTPEGSRLDARPSGIQGRGGLGVGRPERAGSGLNTHGPGESAGEVPLSYIGIFHKTWILDLYRMLKRVEFK